MTTAYSPDGAPIEATLPRRRPRTLALTSVVLSAALIALSVALVDAKQVLERLKATDPRWLLAFFAIYVVQILLLGLRWSTISRALGVPLGWRRASAEYSLSILVNQLLPTGLAGDGWRAVRHARRAEGHPFVRVLEALALDRLSGQIALILVALSSVPWTLEHGLVGPETLWTAAALLGALVVIAISFARNAPSGGGLASRVRGFLVRATAALTEPRRALLHLSISLLLIATCLAQLACAAYAIGLDLDFGLLLWLGPLILLATSVPSFFGGWGIREGASALLFHTVGLGGSSGVALSLLFGAFALVCAMPGFMVLLFEGQFSRRRREHRGIDVTWSNAHAVAMLGGAALAVALHTSALLWFVGALSLLFFIARSRGTWTQSGQFGLANTVTSLRLLLTLVLLAGVDREPGHIAATIALLILGLDLVDGWLARRYAADSPFGACYDMEVDAIFVLSLSCTLWMRGVAGPWVLMAGLWRYLFVVIPLFIPSRGGEAPRSIYYRSAYTVMVLSFVLSLALPAPFARALAAFGTIILSVSFLRSFYYRYRPPDDAARGA